MRQASPHGSRCPGSLAPGAPAWVRVDPPRGSGGQGQGADGGRTGDAAPIRERHLAVAGEAHAPQRPARRQPFRRRPGRGVVQHPGADVADEHRRLSLEHPGRRASPSHRPARSQVAAGQDPRDAGGHGSEPRPLPQHAGPPDRAPPSGSPPSTPARSGSASPRWTMPGWPSR